MSNLSVRGLDPETLSALKALASREGASVNALVLRMIEQGLGRNPTQRPRHRYDDLDALAGSWSADDAAAFEHATAGLREVDPDLWA